MYIRLVRGQPQPGQLDELARRWKEHVGARFGSLPGFRHAYFVGDREVNRVVGISVWERHPGAALDEVMTQFRQQAQDLVAGPPTIEDYEVLAEV